MIARAASSLLPCPLCDGRAARSDGACRACLAALGTEPHADEVAGLPLLWLGAYEGTTLRAVRSIKFGGRLVLAHTVGRRLGECVAARGWPVGRVVPVPLHRTRRWRRGYDQAERIARGVAAALDARFDRPLVRVRGTNRQARAAGSSRVANVAGAFRSSRLPPVPILLVDDVWTTGATAGACAGALRSAGAREVRVAVVARAGAKPSARHPQNRIRLAVSTPNKPPTST